MSEKFSVSRKADGTYTADRGGFYSCSGTGKTAAEALAAAQKDDAQLAANHHAMMQEDARKDTGSFSVTHD